MHKRTKPRLDMRVQLDADCELALKIQEFAKRLPMELKQSTLIRHLVELGVNAGLAKQTKSKAA